MFGFVRDILAKPGHPFVPPEKPERVCSWPLQKHSLPRAASTALPCPPGCGEGAVAAEIPQPCPGHCQGLPEYLGWAVSRAGVQQDWQTDLSAGLGTAGLTDRPCPCSSLQWAAQRVPCPSPEQCQGLSVLAESCGLRPRIQLAGQIQQTWSCLRHWCLFCPLSLCAES